MPASAMSWSKRSAGMTPFQQVIAQMLCFFLTLCVTSITRWSRRAALMVSGVSSRRSGTGKGWRKTPATQRKACRQIRSRYPDSL